VWPTGRADRKLIGQDTKTRQIMAALAKAPDGMTARALSDAVGLGVDSVRQILWHRERSHQVVRAGTVTRADARTPAILWRLAPPAAPDPPPVDHSATSWAVVTFTATVCPDDASVRCVATVTVCASQDAAQHYAAALPGWVTPHLVPVTGAEEAAS